MLSMSMRPVFRPLAAIASRCKSSFASSPIQISVSDDAGTIVCWHPEQPLLYEHTKPMPVTEPKHVDSVIRPEVHEEVDTIMRKPDLSQEDLIRLTYRPRATWQQKGRQYKRHVLHPDPPIDRYGV